MLVASLNQLNVSPRLHPPAGVDGAVAITDSTPPTGWAAAGVADSCGKQLQGHTVIVANCIRFQNQIRLTGTVGLGSLVPRIAKPDGGDVPNINADCSYTRSYDARRSKGAATVTATSVFGAMYAMATFSQPATLLALRCNSATHPYVLARCSGRSMHSAVYIFTTLTFLLREPFLQTSVHMRACAIIALTSTHFACRRTFAGLPTPWRNA